MSWPVAGATMASELDPALAHGDDLELDEADLVDEPDGALRVAGVQGPATAPGAGRATTAAAGADSEGWRGLHPLSVVVNLVPQAWRTIRGAWPILLALVLGAGAGMEVFDLSLLLLFFAMAFGRTFLHFLTLRYRVHAGRFEVRFGLLNRQARELDPSRIQNISLERNLFQRAAGLVELKVETAGDAGVHGLLSALSVEAAEALRAELEALVRASRGEAEPEAATDPGVAVADEAATPPLVEASAAELVAYGLSRRTMGTVAVLTAVGFEVFARLGPEGAEQIRWLQDQPHVLGAAFLLAFAGSWAWSAGGALVRHWGFSVRRIGDRLVSSEGLTTTRRVEIPLRKVQIFQAAEPWLRRSMGYGTVLVETAALGFADGRVRQAEGVMPMVERSELPVVLRAVLPQVGADPWSTPLKPAAPRALYRAVIRRVIRLGLLAGLAAGLAWPDMRGLWAFCAVPLALPLGWLDWRWQGWLITPDAVVARRGFLDRRTWIIARDKVQSLQIVQTPLMRWHRLGAVSVRVAGNAVALPDLTLEDAEAVFDELSPHGRPLNLRTFEPVELVEPEEPVEPLV